jgi:MYXO-CTERM domain-containing protein
LTLLFGGVGVANASTLEAPATTTLAQAQDSQDDDNGDNGLWGLVGLLGLVGLAGLKRRKDATTPPPAGRARQETHADRRIRFE